MTTAGNDTGSSREDELLSSVYRQVTVRQAGRYATTYDMEAGLARFRDWLHGQTAAGADHVDFAATAATAASGADAMRSSLVTEALVAGEIATAIKPEMTAEEAVTQLYMSHYRPLVRLAVLLVRDEPTAEEVVQECFIAMHDGWHRLRDGDKALSYLEQAVVNRSKSVLRHRSAAARTAPGPAPGVPGVPGPEAVSQLERSVVVAALQRLPDRQRQALVLRYYTDLSEAQIAEMMGISRGAVKSHTARGMASLRAVLEGFA